MIRRIDLALSFLALILILALASCAPVPTAAPATSTPTAAPSATPEPVPSETALPAPAALLSIHNTSGHDLKNLVVFFPEARIEIGDLPAGATSDWVEAPTGVYSAAAYEFEQDGKTVTQYVRDWVGFEPLAGSRFTLNVDVTVAGTDQPLITILDIQSE